MAGIDGDVRRAVIHLRLASKAMDRLWNATGNDDVDRAVLGLGEATLAIHQALLALRECDGARPAVPADPGFPADPGVPAIAPAALAR
ncbi:MAG: hypothetical protein ABSG81_08435 [Acidimicrobiales bacterium]